MIENTLRKNVGSSSPAVGIIKGIVVRLVGTYGVGIYQMIIVNLLFDSEYTMACIVKSGVRVKKHKYCHVNWTKCHLTIAVFAPVILDGFIMSN